MDANFKFLSVRVLFYISKRMLHAGNTPSAFTHPWSLSVSVEHYSIHTSRLAPY